MQFPPPVKIGIMSKINTYHVVLFAEFVEKMRSTPDGDGSLLDHSLLLYGAGMSNSNAHAPINLPIMLVGGAGGGLEGGRHITYPEDTPMANLLMAIMDALGVPMDQVGDRATACSTCCRSRRTRRGRLPRNGSLFLGCGLQTSGFRSARAEAVVARAFRPNTGRLSLETCRPDGRAGCATPESRV